jgi:hypothetical protein
MVSMIKGVPTRVSQVRKNVAWEQVLHAIPGTVELQDVLEAYQGRSEPAEESCHITEEAENGLGVRVTLRIRSDFPLVSERIAEYSALKDEAHP